MTYFLVKEWKIWVGLKNDLVKEVYQAMNDYSIAVRTMMDWKKAIVW